DDGNSTKDLATIIVAKHRNGAVDDVKLKFIQDLAKFEDYDRGVSEIVSSDTAVYQTRGSKLNQQSFAEGIANENVGFSNDNSFENSTIPAGFGNGGNEEAPF
ncbi:MAG: hypothetical protein II471_01380, partial [Bacteroidales bacterium]|nr:hypothetical protein [Bacteroidales bacterium]